MNLTQLRIKSLTVQLLSMLGISVLGVFLSEDFRTLITSHFGDSALAGVILLIIPEVVKHYRNVLLQKKLGDNQTEKIYI